MWTNTYRNLHQDEVQSAYWDCTQTCIHAVINYFKCPNKNCDEVVTLVLAQITNDLLHDSFVARAGHEASFKYLSQTLGLKLDYILQFCDNCSSQYKSRRPFAEIARSSLNIIRVFFREKHGKSHCDGFFGRLKAWMTFKIKSRQFIVNNAHEFYRCCKDEYETPEPEHPGTCQHYRVVFQFLNPSDIRRHHDCDLDKAVTGTRSIFSVRNTAEPLKLKIRNVPCLCRACIQDDGQKCENYRFTDEWREVDLIPLKGQSKNTHMKRKHPNQCAGAKTMQKVCQKEVEHETPSHCNKEVDENTPEVTVEEQTKRNIPDAIIDKDDSAEVDILFPGSVPDEHDEADVVNLTETRQNEVTDMFIDLTDGTEKFDDDIDVIEHGDVITDGDVDQDKVVAHYIDAYEEDIPDKVYWESILGRLEGCKDDREMLIVATEIQKDLTPLEPQTWQIHFQPEKDVIDAIAFSSIPHDGPKNVDAIQILPDGNCFCQAISHARFGNDSKHLELRARIAVEAILNKDKYLDHDCLMRGSNALQAERNASLPEIYAKYSDHYVSGQRMTENTVHYLYSREMHDCTKISSYMGLWQIAQAASVLKTTIRSVYPEGADPLMRLDFNRVFFPVDSEVISIDPDKIMTIMWTSMQRNTPPVHFVPLLPKRK